MPTACQGLAWTYLSVAWAACLVLSMTTDSAWARRTLASLRFSSMRWRSAADFSPTELAVALRSSSASWTTILKSVISFSRLAELAVMTGNILSCFRNYGVSFLIIKNLGNWSVQVSREKSKDYPSPRTVRGRVINRRNSGLLRELRVSSRWTYRGNSPPRE